MGKKTKDGWPVEVPVLEAKDIFKGDYGDGHGRCCLLGWMSKVFPIESGVAFGDGTGDSKCMAKVRRAITGVINAKDIVAWNDNDHREKSEIARAWNRAMAKLGYVVGNPEA